jgi:hypothetical protein
VCSADRELVVGWSCLQSADAGDTLRDMLAEWQARWHRSITPTKQELNWDRPTLKNRDGPVPSRPTFSSDHPQIKHTLRNLRSRSAPFSTWGTSVRKGPSDVVLFDSVCEPCQTMM